MLLSCCGVRHCECYCGIPSVPRSIPCAQSYLQDLQMKDDKDEDDSDDAAVDAQKKRSA